jgi:hypothetical protein
MLPYSFSKEHRDNILLGYSQASANYNKALEDEDYELAERHFARVSALQSEYFRLLPSIVMSCCPFDAQPLIRSFDAYGLDGLWWRPDASTRETPTCPHFCVVRGAVNYAGKRPRAGDFEVHPGPEVPYVIPRLLNYPDMIAVVSQIEMKNGYTAYPVTYFAARRPPPQELTAGWARTLHTYTTQLGISGWKADNDAWDFNLLTWLEQGKVRWCPPATDNSVLSVDPPEQCPYLDLNGARERMVVEADNSWTNGLPTGEAVETFDADESLESATELN